MTKLLFRALLLSVVGAGKEWIPGAGWPEVVPDFAIRAIVTIMVYLTLTPSPMKVWLSDRVLSCVVQPVRKIESTWLC